jgi:hypothetical protein
MYHVRPTVGVSAAITRPVAGSFVLVRASMRATVFVYRAEVSWNAIDIVQPLTTSA